jgi:hypothetical protein
MQNHPGTSRALEKKVISLVNPAGNLGEIKCFSET